MLRNSMRIMSASWRVLRQDRELLLFPLMALATSALILVVTVLGARAAGALKLEPDGTTSVAPTLDSSIFVSLGVLAVMAVSIFFNGALTAGAYQRMSGGDPTIASALGHAVERLPALLGWAALNWTLGMAMRFVGPTVGWLGKVLLGGASVLWEIAVYLTVPAIVIDGLGPVRALKRSVSLLRHTWGENLAANAGLGVFAAMLLIPPIPVTALLAGSDNPLLYIGGPVAFVAWIVTVMVAITTLNTIYETALYLYATGERTVATFDEKMLQVGFTVKSSGPQSG